MTPFSEILERAAARHGGAAGIAKTLTEYDFLKTPDDLAATPDNRFLSLMTKCIFQSGFNWKVIENKWPGFEEAFQGFDIDACAFMADDAVDQLCQDTRIVRNRAKIATVPVNARMIQKVRETAGGFGKFLGGWSADDQPGLMDYLKANGARLGGMTGQYFLRFSGWDSYIFSKDVCQALADAGVVEDNKVTSKKDLEKAHRAFLEWRRESGRPLVEISRILALSIGAKS